MLNFLCNLREMTSFFFFLPQTPQNCKTFCEILTHFIYLKCFFFFLLSFMNEDVKFCFPWVLNFSAFSRIA